MTDDCKNTSSFFDITKYSADFGIPSIVFNFLLAVTDILFNFLVIMAIWKKPSLRTPSRLLLCNLAVGDFLWGAIVQPLTVAFIASGFMNWCEYFATFYTLNSSLGYGLSIITLLTLVAIAFDRFLAIYTTNNYNNIVTKKRVLVLVIFLWVVPGPVVAVIRHVKEKDQPAIGPVVIPVMITLILVAIITPYILCFYHLKKFSSQVSQGPDQPVSSNQQTASQFNIWKYRRTLFSMLIILVLILISYLPLVFLLATHTISRIRSVPMLVHICDCFAAMSSTLNPVVSIWRMKDLRQVIKNILFH